MGGFGGVGRMGELYRGAMTSSMERDFGRGDIGINRGFGDSFGRLGSAMIAGRIGASNMGPVGSGISGGMGGMNNVTGGMGMGLDRMSSSFDRMGPGRSYTGKEHRYGSRISIWANGKRNKRQNRLQRQPDICQKSAF